MAEVIWQLKLFVEATFDVYIYNEFPKLVKHRCRSSFQNLRLQLTGVKKEIRCWDNKAYRWGRGNGDWGLGVRRDPSRASAQGYGTLELGLVAGSRRAEIQLPSARVEGEQQQGSVVVARYGQGG